MNGTSPMSLFLQMVLGLGLLLLLAAGMWRLSSRRASIPCPSWLAWMVELDNPFASSHNAANIIRRLRISPGMKVLDVGCGPGRLAVPLAQALLPEGEVLALDLQPGMIERARAKARRAGVTNIRFELRPVEAGGLGEGEYDRALLVTVLGEIPDREAALREIARALKPGGILSITEIVFDPHYQSRASVVRAAAGTALREAGFWGNRLAYTLHLIKTGSA